MSRTLSNTDIWLIDPVRGAPQQFTFDTAFNIQPVWSPDGRRVVSGSNGLGVFDLFEKPVNFAHDERVLLETPENKFPADWSPDGNVVLFAGGRSDRDAEFVDGISRGTAQAGWSPTAEVTPKARASFRPMGDGSHIAPTSRVGGRFISGPIPGREASNWCRAAAEYSLAGAATGRSCSTSRLTPR